MDAPELWSSSVPFAWRSSPSACTAEEAGRGEDQRGVAAGPPSPESGADGPGPFTDRRS